MKNKVPSTIVKFSFAFFMVFFYSTVVFASSADRTNELVQNTWVTKKAFPKMAAHPRLFISRAQIDRVVAGRGEDFKRAYEIVAAAAETGVVDSKAPMQKVYMLHKATRIIGRLTSLATQWFITKDRKYIKAVMENIEGMKRWLGPQGSINLWEGQYIAGVAIAYDLLHNDLTAEEKKVFIRFGREHCLLRFLRNSGPSDASLRQKGEGRMWWMHRISNWNPVSSSGAGMLALAMYEDIPEAQTVIDRVKESHQKILDHIQSTEGGWEEGLGYWNWTVHYVSLFAVSYERSSGVKIESIHSPEFKKWLLFGTHFVPYDIEAGFGDNNHGDISNSLFNIAEHIGDSETAKALLLFKQRVEKYTEIRKETLAKKHPSKKSAIEKPAKGDTSYGVPFKLLLRPDAIKEDQVQKKGALSINYPIQGWGMVADQWPEPTIYASAKGGLLKGDHTHKDLLSWNGMIGLDRMICDIHQVPYYGPSFYKRGAEIYERSQMAKNTIFVSGISAYSFEYERFGGVARANVSHFKTKSGAALRLEATNAFFTGNRQKNPRFVGRLFVTIDDRALLVLDRIEIPGTEVIEVRSHTRKKATFSGNSVLLKGDFGMARMSFASDRPSVLRRATALLTNAKAKPPTMMRWQTLRGERKITMASLLSKGEQACTTEIKSNAKFIDISIKGEDWSKKLRFSSKLKKVN